MSALRLTSPSAFFSRRPTFLFAARARPLFFGPSAPRAAGVSHALYQAEIQLATVDIDVCDLDANDIAQPIAVAAAIAGESVCLFVEPIEVIVERIDVNQTFRRQLDALDEEAEILDARDHRIHRLADSLGEIAQQLDLLQLALGRLGPLLALAALVAEHDHPLQIIDRSLAAGQRLDHPVDRQVRIATDRRREMAIVLLGQRKMPLVRR